MRRTGRGYLLWVMIGAAAVVAAGLIVEHFVVTDRKSIEQTMDAAVAAVEANNINALLDCISPAAEETRGYARRLLDRVEVEGAYVHNLRITINHLTSPPTAVVQFQAIGQGRDRRGEIPSGPYNNAVRVDFRREGDRWLVTGCEVEGLELDGFFRAHGLRAP